MGTSFSASCSCGYEGTSHTGATRATYLHSFFYPHACLNCRAVVNVELAAKRPTCPTCKSPDVIAYGSELPKEIRKHWGPLSRLLTLLAPSSSNETPGPAPQYIDESLNFVSQRRWGLTRGPHLCPSCGTQSLCFELDALFD